MKYIVYAAIIATIIILSKIGGQPNADLEASTYRQTIKTPLQECEYAINMGKMQEKAATKAYEHGDLVETQNHLRVALSNYMSGFKPCAKTNKEEELTNSTSRVNGILTDKNFSNATALQKFFKAAQE
jgi:hypothetical protein